MNAVPAAPHELAVRVEATVLARLGRRTVELSTSSAPVPREPGAPPEG